MRDEIAFPAHDLACAYHERWEVEITIDEMDTHQREPLQPLRSRTPLGVLQELYGLLIAHYCIRKVMHDAAVQAGLPPDRLSFIKSVRILHNAVFEFQIVDETQKPLLYQRFPQRYCACPTAETHQPFQSKGHQTQNVQLR